MAREITTIGVVGLGTMGAGIVEVFARGGVDVVAVEISDAALARGRENLTGSTDRAVARGKLDPAARDALLSRVRFAVGLAELRDADLVIEAVPERLDLKRKLFGELDAVCKPQAILATNTSSLSVTEIAVATNRPGQVVGVHFFNPAPVMKLVEVVRTVVTDPEVVADVEAVCQRLGKVSVTVGDRAGFIANALLFGYLNQAASMYESRYASREDIDAAMRLGWGLPMGPLALLDLIGLDTAAEILDTMYSRGGRDRRHACAPLIRQMVTAGLLGRKTGRGFYTYERPGSGRVVPDELTPSGGEPAAGDAARAVASIGVVGSGPTAASTVEAFARGGYEVVAVVPDGERPDALREAVAAALDRAVRADALDAADRDAVLRRITWSSALDALTGVDLVVEALAGEAGVKKALLADLDKTCKPTVVLATTATTVPVIDVAMATGRPADVVGLHLTSGHLAGGPLAAPTLVEIVHTVRTSPQALATVRAVCAAAGLTGVACGDRAGFVADALMFAYLNDAVRMLEANYATADGIDAAMRLGCGYPTGPFELLDAVGLDVALAVQRGLYRQTREPGLAPAPMLENLVTAGYLGRGTGRGLRDHTAG